MTNYEQILRWGPETSLEPNYRELFEGDELLHKLFSATKLRRDHENGGDFFSFENSGARKKDADKYGAELKDEYKEKQDNDQDSESKEKGQDDSEAPQNPQAAEEKNVVVST